MARRGMTLVELLFVVTLTALAMSVTLAMYAYSVNRLAQGTARFAAADQVRKVLDEAEDVIRDSVSAITVAAGSGTALKCTLAAESKRAGGAVAIDSSTLSVSQSAEPVGVTKRGYEKHGAGKRVWFYLADATGTYGSTGTYLWRAERSDDSTPTTADIVNSWVYYPGTSQRRFPLILTFTPSVSATNRLVTLAVEARSLWRDERTGASTDKASQTFAESRVIGWRNWFQ